MKEKSPDDPKGLIREAFAIDGIGAEECRSIFVDWALSLPEGADTPATLDRLVARHTATEPDHPMTAILREGQQPPARTGRRGGRRGRMQ